MEKSLNKSICLNKKVVLQDIANSIEKSIKDNCHSNINKFCFVSKNTTIKRNVVQAIKEIKKNTTLDFFIEINFSSTIQSDQINNIITGLRQFFISYLAQVQNRQLNYNFIENLNPSEIRTIIKFFPELETIFKKISSYSRGGDHHTIISALSVFNVLNIFLYYWPITIIINNIHLVKRSAKRILEDIIHIETKNKKVFYTYSYINNELATALEEKKILMINVETLVKEKSIEKIKKWFLHPIKAFDQFYTELFKHSKGNIFEMVDIIESEIKHNNIYVENKQICWGISENSLVNKKIIGAQYLNVLFDTNDKVALDILFTLYIFKIRIKKNVLISFTKMHIAEFESIIQKLKLKNIIVEFENELAIDFYNQDIKSNYIELINKHVGRPKAIQMEIDCCLNNLKNVYLLSGTAKYRLYKKLNQYYFRKKGQISAKYKLKDLLTLLRELEYQSQHFQMYQLIKYITPEFIRNNFKNTAEGKELLFFKTLVYKDLNKPIFVRKYLYEAITFCADSVLDNLYFYKLVQSYSYKYEPKNMALILELILAADCKLPLNKQYSIHWGHLIKEVFKSVGRNMKLIFNKQKITPDIEIKLEYYQKILEVLPQNKRLLLSIVVAMKVAYFSKITKNRDAKKLLELWDIYLLYKMKFNQLGKLVGQKKLVNTAEKSPKIKFIKVIFYEFFFLSNDKLAEKLFNLFELLKNNEETLLSNAAFHYYVKSLFYSGTSTKKILEFYKQYSVWCSNHYVLPDHNLTFSFFSYLNNGDNQKFIEENTILRSENLEWGIYATQKINIFFAYFFDTNIQKALAVGKEMIKKINLELGIEYFEFKFFYMIALGIDSLNKNKQTNIYKINQYVDELKKISSENISSKSKVMLLKSLVALIKKNNDIIFKDLEFLDQYPNELYRAVAEEVYFIYFKQNKMTAVAKEYLKLACRRYNQLNIKIKLDYYKKHEAKYAQFIPYIDTINFSQTELLNTIKQNTILSKIVSSDELFRTYFLILQESLETTYIAYLQPQADDNLLLSYECRGGGEILEQNNELAEYSNRLPVAIINYAKNTEKIFNSSDTNSKAIMTSLGNKKFHVSFLVYPIFEKQTLVAILYLEKKAAEFETEKDIKILDLISSQFAISYKNIRLKKQNNDLIINLEKKVEKQVMQIRKSDKEAEKSRELAQKAAAQSAYATLTRGIAHEIRNPMAMMLSGAELVLDNIGNKEKVIKYMTALKDTVLRLKNVTNSMLYYGHSVSTNKKVINLTQIINDVLTICAAECRKQKIQTKSIIKHTSSLLAEENSIHQVLLNIVLNSIQAISDGGNIEISTSDEEFETKNQQKQQGVCIQIKDTGKGIAAEKLDKIFDPFFSTKYGNAGLGLSIVFKTIDLHQGNIFVESKENEYTSIKLYLPKHADITSTPSKAKKEKEAQKVA